MGKELYTCMKIRLLILISLLIPSFAYAQNSSLWLLNSNRLKPVVSTWGLQIPSLTSGCYSADGLGIVSIATCGVGGATSTSPLIVSYFVATSTTATSTIAGNLDVQGTLQAGRLIVTGVILNTNFAASSGVYTNSAKELTTTIPTSGALGYWTRSGTNLYNTTLTDNVGIGTSSPTNTLDVAVPHLSGITISPNANNVRTQLNIISASSAGVRQQWTLASVRSGTRELSIEDTTGGTIPMIIQAAAPSNTLVLTSAGNVGVGTSSPAAKLSVSGVGYFTGNVGIGVSVPAGTLHLKPTGSNALILDTGTAIASGATNYISYRFQGVETMYAGVGSGGSTLFSLENTVGNIATQAASANNFGIGTSSPTSKLAVEGAVYITGNLGVGKANPTDALHILKTSPVIVAQDSDSTGNGQIGFFSFRNAAGTETSYFGDGSSGDSDFYLGSTIGGLRLQTGSADRAYINSSGNFLITEGLRLGFRFNSGDPGPYSYLTAGSGSATLEFHSTASASDDAKNYSFFTRNDNLESLTILGNGRTGVGTTTPAGKLSVENALTAPTFIAADQANDASPFCIDNDGDVGIGTCSPDTYLGGIKGLSIRDLTGGGVPGISISNSTAVSFWFRNVGNLILEDSIAGEMSRYDSAGKFGMGTTSPWARLSIKGFANSTPIASFGTSANFPALTIATNGDIGIGSSNPTADLGGVKGFAVRDTVTNLPGFNFTNSSGNYFFFMRNNTFTIEDPDTQIFTIATDNVGAGTSTPSSKLTTGGSFAAPIKRVTTTYTVTANDYTILCDASAGGYVINLPTASGITGRIYTFKKIDSTGNICTLDPAGTETIDFALSQTLDAPMEAITIQQASSTAWVITGGY